MKHRCEHWRLSTCQLRGGAGGKAKDDIQPDQALMRPQERRPAWAPGRGGYKAGAEPLQGGGPRWDMPGGLCCSAGERADFSFQSLPSDSLDLALRALSTGVFGAEDTPARCVCEEGCLQCWPLVLGVWAPWTRSALGLICGSRSA